jgi:hypothetical protein
MLYRIKYYQSFTHNILSKGLETQHPRCSAAAPLADGFGRNGGLKENTNLFYGWCDVG